MTYQQPQKRPVDLHELALRFEKRRFDGGTEVDLIQQIEEQQARQLAQAGLVSNERAAAMVSRPRAQRVVQRIQPAYQAAPVKPRNKVTAAWEAIIVGPLEIAVGAVGVLTSILALATFFKSKNEVMAQQSKLIMRDCSITFVRGFLNSAMTPVRLVKIAMGQ